MLQVLPVCMALAERRYRRNWCIPFYRQLVRIGSAFPRLHPKGTSSRFALRAPRPRWGLAMTNLEAFAVLTIACTNRKRYAGSGCPLPYTGLCDWCFSVHALEHHRVFRAEHSAPVAAFLVLRRRQIELVVLHGIVEDILPVLPALRQVEDAVRGRIGPG